MSILYELAKERIFTVERKNSETFIFSDVCDMWYEHILSRSEMLQLAKELEELANEPW
jgi:hypothetical protein